MNIFLRAGVSLLKLIALLICAYLFLNLFFAENATQIGIGLFILIFITLPTIYLIFFKKRLPKLAGFWKIYRFFYIIFIVLYVAAWAFGTWHLNQLAKTQKTIEFINSKKITLDDVMGKNLPPQPDQKINDSTIAGIDANNNYIRDDVELAIFKKYPDSAKIRAAELQYAQALQLELTQVFNSDTLVAVMKKESRGIDCIGKTGPKINLNDSHDKIISDFNATDKSQKEVEDLCLNTYLRKKENSDILEKYMAGYASLPGDECDINLSSLVE